MSELFDAVDAVDALVASRAPLPPAEERKRLRPEPRGPEREAYARLLDMLRELYPAPAATLVPATFTAQPASDERTLFTGPAPDAVKAPVFDPKLPGSWLVDLSHIDLSRVKVGKDKWADLEASLLPSPFTPKDERPEGTAWYASPTVAYAVEEAFNEAQSAAGRGRRLAVGSGVDQRDGALVELADRFLGCVHTVGAGQV